MSILINLLHPCLIKIILSFLKNGRIAVYINYKTILNISIKWWILEQWSNGTERRSGQQVKKLIQITKCTGGLSVWSLIMNCMFVFQGTMKTWQTAWMQMRAESMWGVSDENTGHLLKGQCEEEVKPAVRFIIAFLLHVQSKVNTVSERERYLFFLLPLIWTKTSDLRTCWQVSGSFEISTQEKNISNALTENNCMETFSLLCILSSYSDLVHSIRASSTQRQSCNAHNLFWVELIKEQKIAKRCT